MNKPIKYCLAIVLTKKNDPKQFLIVKRPPKDPDLAAEWGLPAVTLRPGELPEAAAERVCIEKLNCQASSTRFLGIMFQKRNAYDIFLMDIEMVLIGEQQPDVRRAQTSSTTYTEQRWSTDPMDLMPAARNGSCCASIFLSDRELLDRNEWIASLEGSDIVG